MLAILDEPRAVPTQVLAQFVEPLEVRRRFVQSNQYLAGNATQ